MAPSIGWKPWKHTPPKPRSRTNTLFKPAGGGLLGASLGSALGGMAQSQTGVSPQSVGVGPTTPNPHPRKMRKVKCTLCNEYYEQEKVTLQLDEHNAIRGWRDTMSCICSITEMRLEILRLKNELHCERELTAHVMGINERANNIMED